MSGNEVGDKNLDQKADSKADRAVSARAESNAGMQEQSDSTKSYYQARKEGMRDKATMENLGPKPEFFDSSVLTNQTKLGDDASDQSQEKHYSGVQHDEKDRVSAVKYPDGKITTVKYDSHNNPIDIKTPDGDWRKDKDGWNCYDEHNKKVAHLNGEMQVKPNGEVIAKEKSGYTENYAPDGTLTRSGFPDGHTETTKDGRTVVEDARGNKNHISYDKSEVRTDAQDHVTSIKSTDGKTTSFKYDGDKLSEIHNPDGSYSKVDHGLWYKYDKQGNYDGQDKNTYSVDKDGTLTRTSLDGKEIETKHPDNSREVKYSNGSEMDYDKNGHLERSVYPTGRQIRYGYDRKGELSYVQEYDQGQLKESLGKTRDGKWFGQHGPDGHTFDVDRKYKLNPQGDLEETAPNGTKRIQYEGPKKP